MRQLVTKPPLRINMNFNKPQTTRNPWHLSLVIAGAFYSFYFSADIFTSKRFQDTLLNHLAQEIEKNSTVIFRLEIRTKLKVPINRIDSKQTNSRFGLQIDSDYLLLISVGTKTETMALPSFQLTCISS